jgi:hypothetical protein
MLFLKVLPNNPLQIVDEANVWRFVGAEGVVQGIFEYSSKGGVDSNVFGSCKSIHFRDDFVVPLDTQIFFGGSVESFGRSESKEQGVPQNLL